jgi:hypothetical protein
MKNDFNPAVSAIIDALGGDGRSGGDHLPCPVCEGNSMSVKAGEKVPVVVHCFKCGAEGGPAIVAAPTRHGRLAHEP